MRRLTRLISLDALIGLILFAVGLYAYTATLAPTVLEGDAALFQYTPAVLGVTYPTGYPLYILLGKLWLMILPFGEIAWRMNLLSAVCAALALPLIYGAARNFLATIPPPSLTPLGGGATSPPAGESKRGQTVQSPPQRGGLRGGGVISPPAQQLAVRLAGLAAALTFATLPTYWRWATEAKIYALNILLFSAVLFTLSICLMSLRGRRPKQSPLSSAAGATAPPPSLPPPGGGVISPPPGGIKGGRTVSFLWLFPFLLGLQIAVHSTTVLLIPGLALLVWLNLRRLITRKTLLLWAVLLVLPGLLYFYVPLRGEWLLAQYGRAEAIARGLLADFYHSGWRGWVRYFTAADFTGGVVTNWGLVPQQFVAVYLPIVIENLRPLGAALALTGGLTMAITRPRLFWPLFLLYAAPIPFVLTYGQGEQTAFLMPSFLITALFAGYNFVILTSLGAMLTARRSSVAAVGAYLVPVMLFIALLNWLIWPQTQYNVNRLENKWDRRIFDEWADALAHPLPPDAALLAHWGDLTSFWYMQHAEGSRPDLRGLYPPTEAVVTDYLQHGGDLFIAGPLQGWAAGIEDRYRLLPWGRLVRIAPRFAEPASLLPPVSRSFGVDFSDQVRLLGADFPAEAAGGIDFPVTLAWQALANLPPETTISLRLAQGDGITTQLDDALLSGWFPRDTLPAGQHILSYAPLPVPLGTLPGRYRLQLVAYTDYKQPWPLPDGGVTLDLGEVTVVSPPPDFKLPPDTGQWLPYRFNGELELVDYDYSVSRVGQGKGFALRLLWRTLAPPVDNYTLRVELTDAAGQVLRTFDQPPVGGQLPTSAWQAGQFIRDQVDVVVPAGAPPGEDALGVRLSWLRPDGSALKVHRWLWPTGHSAALDWLRVTEKEGRQFDAPPLQTRLDLNLENKARLLGYNSSLQTEPGRLDLDPAACPADSGCSLQLDVYWQGISEMVSPYLVFFHVVDAQGQIVAQRDRAPGARGKQPTTGWLPGEVVADPITLPLPADLPPGEYTIRLGMYLPPAGPRLLVLDETGQPVADFVEAGQLVIQADQE